MVPLAPQLRLCLESNTFTTIYRHYCSGDFQVFFFYGWIKRPVILKLKNKSQDYNIVSTYNKLIEMDLAFDHAKTLRNKKHKASKVYQRFFVLETHISLSSMWYSLCALRASYIYTYEAWLHVNCSSP